MTTEVKDIIQKLEDKIILYKHLGLTPTVVNADEVRFQVSLEKSSNHKGTAFGGSLYADAVLAAYTLILVGLRHRGFATENIVIAKGEIKYLRPIDSDFEVHCTWPSQEASESFFADLKSKGKGRITLKSQISGVNASAGSILTGDFVVIENLV